MFCLSTALLFTSCEPEQNDSGNLNGLWSSQYDGYEINTKTNKIYYLDNYEADIVNSPDYSASNGVLIIKFTSYFEVVYDNTDWSVISEGWTDAYNGKFGAVYWIELTSNSVKMANAYDSETWEHSMYNSLPEANAAFTPYQDKAGNFVSQWGTYTK
jgi:hypothetical protein